MNELIIIMAAGRGSRWKDVRGVSTWYKQTDKPKQMAVVNGETIIERTIRLIGNRRYFITVPPGRRLPIEANQIEYDSPTEIDRFYPTEERVIYLYGDVYYTEQAMQGILDGPDGFYGKTKSMPGFKKATEIFAVKGCGKKIAYHAGQVRTALATGKTNRGIGWDLYKSFYGQPWQPLKPTEEEMRHIFPINDGTDDIDRISDHKLLIARFGK